MNSDVEEKKKNLSINVSFKGLDNMIKNSANSDLKVKAICTEKTSVKVEILKS